eukprot:849486-Pyramimonas_sp.AAC.1
MEEKVSEIQESIITPEDVHKIALESISSRGSLRSTGFSTSPSTSPTAVVGIIPTGDSFDKAISWATGRGRRHAAPPPQEQNIYFKSDFRGIVFIEF